jgi:hypothetical protein
VSYQMGGVTDGHSETGTTRDRNYALATRAGCTNLSDRLTGCMITALNSD